jgi:hypothetical protein
MKGVAGRVSTGRPRIKVEAEVKVKEKNHIF